MSEVCAICLSDLGDDPSLLQTWTGCNEHTFHKACLCGWLMQGKQTCPSCRSNLNVNKDSDVESVDSDSSSDSDESSALVSVTLTGIDISKVKNSRTSIVRTMIYVLARYAVRYAVDLVTQAPLALKRLLRT